VIRLRQDGAMQGPGRPYHLVEVQWPHMQESSTYDRHDPALALRVVQRVLKPHYADARLLASDLSIGDIGARLIHPPPPHRDVLSDRV
jgi:hypothetical protein